VSRTRADSITNGTERPPRVSLDCLDLGGSGSVHTLSVTCSARILRTPLHFHTGDDADTCPPLATTQCGQQRRGQRRSDLRKVAHSASSITLPVGNALARWQLTTRRATRSGFISPFQTVGPTLVRMLLDPFQNSVFQPTSERAQEGPGRCPDHARPVRVPVRPHPARRAPPEEGPKHFSPIATCCTDTTCCNGTTCCNSATCCNCATCRSRNDLPGRDIRARILEIGARARPAGCAKAL